MNTTVILAAPLDLGAGSHDRIDFSGCRWQEDGGTLHIFREGGKGQVAAFGPGSWLAAVEGGAMVAAAGGVR